MAALLEGQQYGLSSQSKNSGDKTLIFVKLTDSALNAVERYVRQRSDSALKPTIQFQGNNGFICLPKDSNSCNKQTYDFTLSNVEADGPQGSFECLRQSGSKSLESLGSMMFKMQIHANEESYEKTRVKMAAVEKENKKFCTKEIKPSGTYGRKLKRPISALPKSSSPPLTTLTTKLTVKAFGTPAPPASQLNSSNNVSRQGLTNKTIKNPELLRQSLRDRIIHLLALRSYKKPELMAKLFYDGIKEKERKGITMVISQVAVLRGNSFSLANHAWNEVQESWKFYSQEEAEIVKKKKYEILNPNNESNVAPLTNTQENISPSQKRTLNEIDNSSNHNQRNKKQRISHFSRTENVTSTLPVNRPTKADATSVVNGIEKSDHGLNLKNSNLNGQVHPDWNGTIKSNNLNAKIPSYNGSLAKANGVRNLSQNNSTNDNVDDGINQHVGSGGSLKHMSSENEKSSHRYSFDTSQKKHSNNENEMCQQTPSLSQRNSLNNQNEKSVQQLSVTLYRKTVNNTTEKSSTNNNQYLGLSCGKIETPLRPIDSSDCGYSRVTHDSNIPYSGNALMVSTYGDKSVNIHKNNGRLVSCGNNSYSLCRQKMTTGHGSCQTSPNSSCDSRDSADYEGDQDMSPPKTRFGYPEYFKEYNVIVSGDQRTKYKNDFNAQYQEYLILHDRIKLIAQHFTALEFELRNYAEDSDKYNEVKNRILQEYARHLKDTAYQEAKKKLHFLHEKLSYIKRLVVEYDSAQSVKS